MDKEELERDLEKVEKGCVITVINQSSLPLSFDSSKHPHGKFRAKPPKTIIARETASFSLEGRRSIEASVRFKWGKGRLELFWNLPEHSDPKIFYRVAPQLKNKLFVNIPTAVFGKVTKLIFLVDDKPATPLSPQDLSSLSNPDTNDDFSAENTSDGENESTRSFGNGDIASKTKPEQKDDDDKGLDSYGFSSDEDDEPKKINVVIKPKSDASQDTLVSPVFGIGPPTSGPPTNRRRVNAKNQTSPIFGDLTEELFQSPSPSPSLSFTSSLHSTPLHSPIHSSSFSSPFAPIPTLTPIAPLTPASTPSSPFNSPFSHSTPSTPVVAAPALISTPSFPSTPSTHPNGMDLSPFSSPFSSASMTLSAGSSSLLSPEIPRRLSRSGESESKSSPNLRSSALFDGPVSLNHFPSSPQLPLSSYLAPPMNPTLSPRNTPASSPSSSIYPNPSPHSPSLNNRNLFKGSIDLELEGLGFSPSPLTPKPSSHTPEIGLAVRGSTPGNVHAHANANPFIPTPSAPKSPPQIVSKNFAPNNAAIAVPTKTLATATSPPVSSKRIPIGSPSSPARSTYAPMSPPIQRHPIGRGVGDDLAAAGGTERLTPRRYSEPPPVDPNLLFPEITAAAKDTKKKQDILTPCARYMNAAIAHLENNAVPAALGNIDLCISLLGSLPDETVLELEYSSRYRLFLLILKELARPKPPSEHAFLSFFLSDIPVRPYHRVIAIRLAIRHNLVSQNFGIAAALIQYLVERVHPVDESSLLEKFKKCAGMNKANYDLRFKRYTCPGCESTTSISGSKCTTCQQSLKLCASTLEMITTKAYYSCRLCKMNFSRKSISSRDTADLKCPFCKVGELINKAFSTIV